MSMLYSERTIGTKPRVNEQVDHSIWKGIIVILESLRSKNYFAEEFPEICPDNTSHICGTDDYKLNDILSSYFELSWPLAHTRVEESNLWSYSDPKPYSPGINLAFDLLEFLYAKTSTPHEYGFHSFFAHAHLSFKPDNQAKNEFRNKINEFFRIRGMIYEMNPEGQLQKIINDETKQLISKVLKFRSQDIQLNQMLYDAYTKISHYDLNVSYHALEKLWDAWERLKCYYIPDNKKESAKEIIKLFSDNPEFQAIINEEMRTITSLGNTFRIRHSEPTQVVLNSHSQINYLFHRCLALIVLIFDYIK